MASLEQSKEMFFAEAKAHGLTKHQASMWLSKNFTTYPWTFSQWDKMTKHLENLPKNYVFNTDESLAGSHRNESLRRAGWITLVVVLFVLAAVTFK